jgi:hypothetical protein
LYQKYKLAQNIGTVKRDKGKKDYLGRISTRDVKLAAGKEEGILISP